jgi:hypothetical protein
MKCSALPPLQPSFQSFQFKTISLIAALPPSLQVFKSYAQEFPSLCHPHDPNDPNATTKPGVLYVPTRLVCGGLAGAIGQTIVYPLDTVCIARIRQLM